MISRLKGIVLNTYPGKIEIEVQGIGYWVDVPMSAYDKLKPVNGDAIEVKTYFHIRENLQVLYGFSSDEERTVFVMLIQRVSGIGPSVAMAILSGLSVEGFKQSVVTADIDSLVAVKGLGRKTAERIVLELKDKVGVVETWEKSHNLGQSNALLEAEAALIALGYKQREVNKILQTLSKQESKLSVEELIRKSLRSLM